MRNMVKDDVLKRYLEDIRHTAPISREEEHSLFILAKQGNKLARERLVAANMRFVLKVVLRYRTSKIPMHDLISEGNMGLIRAVESFDHTRGIKFISYAVWWIKAYINRAINDQGGVIRLPANQILRLKKAMRKVEPGTPLEDDLTGIWQIYCGCSSLDEPIAEEDGRGMGDLLVDQRSLTPEQEVELSQLDAEVMELLNMLSERESFVLKGVYGIEREAAQNLRSVGETLNLSHERVRQLRNQALSRIRRSTLRPELREKLHSYLRVQNAILEET